MHSGLLLKTASNERRHIKTRCEHDPTGKITFKLITIIFCGRMNVYNQNGAYTPFINQDQCLFLGVVLL